MKIESSNITMQARQFSLWREESSQNLRFWRTDDGGAANRNGQWPALSSAGRAALAADAGTTRATSATQDSEATVRDDPFLGLVIRMVEMLTGERVRIFDMRELTAPQSTNVTLSAPSPGQATPTAERVRAGYGLEYDFRAVREEMQVASFSASGTIRTSDGQEISFNLDLLMARYQREETNVSLRAGDAQQRKDPLVLDFDGPSSLLSSQRFRFDLDGDGKSENLPMLGQGAFYLALDRDGNGRIDSGRDLFGPQSGNGFVELARLDDDRNGWVDENDAAFAQLRLWQPASNGPGPLATLKEYGVGAIYLGHLATAFELRGEAGEDLGAVRASGFYLRENGAPGLLRQIDLSV